MSTLQAPAIGQPWPGQGGIYAGLVRGRDGAPDTHLVVGPEADNELVWKAAGDFALSAAVDEHHDFTLPTRAEQAILFGNVPELFKRDWYWSAEKHASVAGYAWCQTFDDGGQRYRHIYDKLRARAVRRFPAR